MRSRSALPRRYPWDAENLSSITITNTAESDPCARLAEEDARAYQDHARDTNVVLRGLGIQWNSTELPSPPRANPEPPEDIYEKAHKKPLPPIPGREARDIHPPPPLRVPKLSRGQLHPPGHKRHRTLPETPSPEDLEELNTIFHQNRSKQKAWSSTLPVLQPARQRPVQWSASIREPLEGQTASIQHLDRDLATDTKREGNTFTRMVRRLRNYYRSQVGPKSFQKGSKPRRPRQPDPRVNSLRRPEPSSAAAPVAPGTLNAPRLLLRRAGTGVSASSSMRRPTPRDPFTRLKRVLSALIEERVSIAWAPPTEAESEDWLCWILEQTQHQLLGQLQRPPIQGQSSTDTVPRQTQPSRSCDEPRPATSSGPISSRSLFNQGICEIDSSASTPWPSRASSAVSGQIILCVLENVEDLEALFAMALVNRATYVNFKHHELRLVRKTLWRMSPAAWELRQISEANYGERRIRGYQSLMASLYVRHYTRDLDTVVNLKALLEKYCRPFLRKETVHALEHPCNAQSRGLDAAIWRVWTFCELFGNRKNREADVTGQLRWLRGQSAVDPPSTVRLGSPDPNDVNTVLFVPPDGFAEGNHGGLSISQLHDLVEVWTGMAALLDFLRGETQLARQYGVFDSIPIAPNDAVTERIVLRAWLDFVLTLGPSVVVSIAPHGPRSDPELAFFRARTYGWTGWEPSTPSITRSSFLTSSVSIVLQSLHADHPSVIGHSTGYL
ncbi:conserved hypothetical protein [Paecilomyces variotii No. 5]|uniref:Uncharacterized protein n=1 Tax=Byssochlamys spectabilis (strain No. 5 / NBRC 109023) TaxID=1356009 RepID=V5FKA1_BYSSN|nr:conserved hypothetical protein [Paecilomyces variotii No. 5]